MKETKIDSLIAACIYLKGDPSGNSENYNYGPGVCKRCGLAVESDGQEAMNALATSDGIFFRCKVPCACGGNTGFVPIFEDKEEHA